MKYIVFREKMEKIAVLIPCYNESRTIEKVIKDWKKNMPEAVIYVYDNNSTDNTAEIAKCNWIYRCAESACPVFWKSPVRKEEITVPDR